MAPPERRPPPPEQLRRLLAARRAEGATFDDAWRPCLRAVVWPHDTTHRRQWREAIAALEAEWRAAYEGRETPAARLFGRLPPELFEPEGGASGELTAR